MSVNNVSDIKFEDIKKIGVSVIVPTYKQIDFLNRSLQSLRLQTHQLIEVIVVDDNDDDEYSKSVKDVINMYSDLDIIYSINDSNIGAARSRNRGVSLSKYPIITFLDDDDYYVETKVEDQLSDMVISKSDYSVCNIILEYSNGLKDIRKRKFLSNDEDLIVKHLKYHVAANSTFMMKKSLFENVNGYPIGDLGDDFQLMLEIITKSDKFTHCDKELVIANVDGSVGLSSFENKIKSEEGLMNLKKKYFDLLSQKDLKYVNMRHNAVIGLSYMKGKRFLRGFFALVRSFMYHPSGFVELINGKGR